MAENTIYEQATHSTHSEDVVDASQNQNEDQGRWRDLAAFWILGLCNNFGFVVMLTAAEDILKEVSGNDPDGKVSPTVQPGSRICSEISTGVILLADIIPTLVIKLIAPFLPFYIRTRTIICCFLSILSFVLVAFATNKTLAVLGVAITSLGSGFGESTFLAYSAYFNKNVVSTWSSGTGGAGVSGAISYSLFRSFGLSNQKTFLIMIVVPLLQGITFFWLLRKPAQCNLQQDVSKESLINHNSGDCQDVPTMPLSSFKEKMKYIPNLFIYFIPLTLVYFFKYFINQGLFELVYFTDISLSTSEQYRWYQVTYQIGVFISRSSVNMIPFKHVWILSFFQFINVIYFTVESIYMFTPNIWIIFGVILFEGLIGGGAYVNTFYRISQEVPAIWKEFALSVVTLSDSVGITTAGILAIPAHNWICGLPATKRTL